MLLISLDDVDVRLFGADILSGVAFDLREGESWAILGANGSGKTTLLRLLRGDVWPHPASRGRRVYHFPDGPSESPIGARERIAFVSAEAQDAYERREWNVSVEDVVRSGFAGGVWVTEPLSAAQERSVDEAIELLGIGHVREERILEVSSGEARKALLARALAPRPRVLLLDEFCNGLDASSRRVLLDVVSAIVRGGTPIVFATHRTEEIVPEVTHAAVLEGGRIVARGRRADVLPAPSPPRTPAPASAGPLGRILISIEHADVLVDGRRVLRDVTWRMRDGENWVVRGPNGAGKSTFLRLLLAEEHVAPGGRIERLDLGDRPSVWDVKARIGAVTPRLQADHRLDSSGEEIVLSGFFASIGLGDEPTAQQREAAARWMDRLGVGHLARRRIDTLSYGELRKLLLARALVVEPEVLLLDEPFNGLDPSSREEMMRIIQGLCESGTRIVMVTHHDSEVVPAVNREMELLGGRIVRQGPQQEPEGFRAGAGR